MPTKSSAIYLTLYYRPSPPGDLFHWAIYVRDKGDKGMLFHATQSPSWKYIAKEYSFDKSMNALVADKIGSVPHGTTLDDIKAKLDPIFQKVPLEHSEVDKDREWDCCIWVRDAVRALNTAGAIKCTEVDLLEAEARKVGDSLRDKVPTGEAPAAVFDSDFSK